METVSGNPIIQYILGTIILFLIIFLLGIIAHFGT
jgi:hypothetical protein